MKLLIAGAGGHGRVVADAATSTGRFSGIAFIDDASSGAALREGWPVVGNLEALDALRGQHDAFIACFGKAALRERVLARALASGWACPPIVHSAAHVSPHAKLGEGTAVIAGAVVNVGARLGTGCIVNTGATVDHDCDVGDFVHICPGANIAGGVTIGSRTWFGIGAVVLQGVKIGHDVIVGAGTVVIRDVPDNTTVVGNPARVIKR